MVPGEKNPTEKRKRILTTHSKNHVPKDGKHHYGTFVIYSGNEITEGPYSERQEPMTPLLTINAGAMYTGEKGKEWIFNKKPDTDWLPFTIGNGYLFRNSILGYQGGGLIKQGKITHFREGEVAIVSVDSQIIIDGYRTLRVLEAMKDHNPTSRLAALEFPVDFYRERARTPSLWETIKMKCGKKIDFTSESQHTLEKQVERKKLDEIMRSRPRDSNSQEIFPGQKVDLFLLDCNVPPEQATQYFKHPEEIPAF
jgi:hypothetical protein